MEIEPEIPYDIKKYGARESERDKHPFYSTQYYSQLKRVIHEINPVKANETTMILKRYPTGKKIIITN